MATSYFKLIPNTNFDNNGAAGGWITYNAGSAYDLVYGLINGTVSSPSINNTQRGAWRPSLGYICAGGCDYDGGIASWTPNLRNVLNFEVHTQVDLDDLNLLLSGKTVEFLVIANITRSGITYDYPLFYFYKQNFPVLNSSSSSVISDRCITEMPNWGSGTFSCVNVPINNSEIASIKTYSFSVENGVQDCTDVRSSLGTSQFLITVNGVNPYGDNDSRSYDLLIQPDSSHTNGSISLSSSDDIHSAFREFTGASVRMVDNVCCHDVGYIDIYGTVSIHGTYFSETTGTELDMFIPHFISEDINDVLLLRARFDDECCCYATGYTERLSEVLDTYLGNVPNLNLQSSICVTIVPTSISWSGFARLSDFCCDNSDCANIDDLEYDIEYPPISSGGGGGDVDISCICDGLTSMTSMLSNKLDSLVLGQGRIVEAIEGVEVSLDDECICDNLGGIADKLDGIKESIDDKELSVTNSPEITVTPCQPIVTNPVNNITVTPSTAEITTPITVTPCQPIVTNPVNNITVTPSTAEITNPITVTPCQPTIQNVINEGDITIDNEDLIAKLDELFKSDDKTITDVIKDKDMGSNIDVEVSPADDVNINRVYYTNQRNGDTNI